jgi:hypothetical protein
VRGLSGLDDLARVFFPDNANHRRAFVAIWLEIKYADSQFLASTADLTSRYGVSGRTIEIVRAKMSKLGLVKRVSHFSPAFSGQSGWIFSPRFRHSLASFNTFLERACEPPEHDIDKRKDEDALRYV